MDNSLATYPTARTVRRGLRHEVVSVFVMVEIVHTQPSVLPLVRYQDVRYEQSDGTKLLGQCIPHGDRWSLHREEQG